MELLKNENGFCLQARAVKYNFAGEALPTRKGEWYELNLVGEVPVPRIQRGDRLLLPVDEGIVIAADGEYLSGDLDCSCIRGRMSGREGTMSIDRGAAKDLFADRT